MDTNYTLQKNKDKSFILSLKLRLTEIKTEETRVLQTIQKSFHSPGFRPGHAPLNFIKQETSELKIVEEILNRLLDQKYQQITTAEKIKPVIEPKIEIKNPPLTFDKDWEIEIQSAEIPEITIDSKYVAAIKKTNQDPKKDLNAVLDTLLKYCTAEIPQIILDHESQHRPSIDPKEIKKEWTLNLAFNQISLDQKLEITSEDLTNMVKANPKMAQNPNLAYYLLHQQKVVNYLKSLK